MGAEAKPQTLAATPRRLVLSARTVGLSCRMHSSIRTLTTVPLVWQHGHNEPSNVLGHAILEHRDDGVYAYGFFNDTDRAKNAKTLVEHGDIKSLSIYANQLTEKSKQVLHGFIRELSLVLSGANPGALIDNITLAHSDGDLVTLEDEAIIYTGLELQHAEDDSEDESDEHAEDDSEDDSDEGPTVQEVYDAMTDEAEGRRSLSWLALHLRPRMMRMKP